jgi:glutathione S-transferase
MIGDRLSYVDLSMFVLFEGLRWSFPETMKRMEPQYPGLSALHDAVAARPHIAAYLASPRHMAFNDRGIFRRYPELDVPPA